MARGFIEGGGGGNQSWARPVPVIGDATSARTRREDPAGWAMGESVVEAFESVAGARRDIRRFRPDPVPTERLEAVLEAGHRAPSVGHPQPWRFIVVREQAELATRVALAGRCSAARARRTTSPPDRAARLLDLRLEGLGRRCWALVVACDRSTPALKGLLGHATPSADADLWTCATAIENMWLSARALGLGMGRVTLVDSADLAELFGLPGNWWSRPRLALPGLPDERPPEPGLQRAGWSTKTPLADVVLRERWSERAPAQPVSHLRGPDEHRLVAATDDADDLLAPPDSLGVLDRALNRVVALGDRPIDGGTLVLASADHPVADLGVSPYAVSVTREVTEAAVAGTSMGAVAARTGGLDLRVVDEAESAAMSLVAAVVIVLVVDRGDPLGDLASADALTAADVDALLATGRDLGRRSAERGLVVLGEIGVGNTTVAAAVACCLHRPGRRRCHRRSGGGRRCRHPRAQARHRRGGPGSQRPLADHRRVTGRSGQSDPRRARRPRSRPAHRGRARCRRGRCAGHPGRTGRLPPGPARDVDRAGRSGPPHRRTATLTRARPRCRPARPRSGAAAHPAAARRRGVGACPRRRCSLKASACVVSPPARCSERTPRPRIRPTLPTPTSGPRSDAQLRERPPKTGSAGRRP